MDKWIDRHHAGCALSGYLKPYANQCNTMVLALPRGGVPVAYEIARSLTLPLDVFVVRKLGVPKHEEFAMGAIASGGSIILNDSVIQDLNLNQRMIDAVVQAEQAELKRREFLYRGMRVVSEVYGKTIILVDDGIATGSSMMAAILALQDLHPLKIVVAVPVASEDSYQTIASLVDELVCPLIPHTFYAVGQWYEQFLQITDDEVVALLENAQS
jgi:predicted phosphoribosyltransferase